MNQNQVPMNENLVLKKINFHTFFKSVVLDIEEPLNLDKIARNFKLDVEIIDNKLYQGSLIVDKPIKVCTTRTKNKNVRCSKGFVKVIHPTSKYSLNYSNPPDFIFIGAYCSSCKKEGPNTHDNSCSNPSKSSMFFTYSGLVQNLYNFENCSEELSSLLKLLFKIINDIQDDIIDKKSYLTNITDNTNDFSNDFSSTNSESKKYKEFKLPPDEILLKTYQFMKKNYKKEFDSIFSDSNSYSYSNYYSENDYGNDSNSYSENEFENESENEFKNESENESENDSEIDIKNYRTKIKILNLFPSYKKDIRGYFSGPLLFTYTNNNKSCTIRLSDKGIISFVSNPWINKDLYKEFMNRLELHDSYTIKNMDIHSLFSSVNMLIYDDITNVPLKNIDIKKLYKYIEKSMLTIETNNGTYKYLHDNNDSYY